MTSSIGSRAREAKMQIRVGYELVYSCPQPTPMIVTLSIHYTRVSDLLKPDHLILTPSIPITAYRDSFGNWCSRIVAPPGRVRLSADALVNDSGQPDLVVPGAKQHAVQDLPEESLIFLLGSRYCETDLLSDIAWKLFADSPTGWGRVQAICDFVHHHISFWLSACQIDQDGLAGVSRARRRLPRLCPLGYRFLPLPEYSRPLLHRLSW